MKDIQEKKELDLDFYIIKYTIRLAIRDYLYPSEVIAKDDDSKRKEVINKVRYKVANKKVEHDLGTKDSTGKERLTKFLVEWSSPIGWTFTILAIGMVIKWGLLPILGKPIIAAFVPSSITLNTVLTAPFIIKSLIALPFNIITGLVGVLLNPIIFIKTAITIIAFLNPCDRIVKSIKEQSFNRLMKDADFNKSLGTVFGVDNNERPFVIESLIPQREEVAKQQERILEIYNTTKGSFKNSIVTESIIEFESALLHKFSLFLSSSGTLVEDRELKEFYEKLSTNKEGVQKDFANILNFFQELPDQLKSDNKKPLSDPEGKIKQHAEQKATKQAENRGVLGRVLSLLQDDIKYERGYSQRQAKKLKDVIEKTIRRRSG